LFQSQQSLTQLRLKELTEPRLALQLLAIPIPLAVVALLLAQLLVLQLFPVSLAQLVFPVLVFLSQPVLPPPQPVLFQLHGLQLLEVKVTQLHPLQESLAVTVQVAVQLTVVTESVQAAQDQKEEADACSGQSGEGGEEEGGGDRGWWGRGRRPH
jgi:hypothetical protein